MFHFGRGVTRGHAAAPCKEGRYAPPLCSQKIKRAGARAARPDPLYKIKLADRIAAAGQDGPKIKNFSMVSFGAASAGLGRARSAQPYPVL